MLKTIRRQIRQWFFTGMLTLFPVIATIWILKTLVVWLEGFFLGLLPLAYQPRVLFGNNIPGLGLLATLAIILLVGMSMHLYIAKRLMALGELMVTRIPIARGVYAGIKRLIQLFMGNAIAQVSRVVLVTYPTPPSRAIGFVTGEDIWYERDGTAVRHLRVFIPTTPNPTSGFLLLVPAEETIPTHLSIEEASKMIVSGGLV